MHRIRPHNYIVRKGQRVRVKSWMEVPAMPQTKMDRALHDVNNAYNEVCPADKQGTIWRIVSALRAEGSSQQDQLAQAVAALHDGVAYGNW